MDKIELIIFVIFTLAVGNLIAVEPPTIEVNSITHVRLETAFVERVADLAMKANLYADNGDSLPEAKAASAELEKLDRSKVVDALIWLYEFHPAAGRLGLRGYSSPTDHFLLAMGDLKVEPNLVLPGVRAHLVYLEEWKFSKPKGRYFPLGDEENVLSYLIIYGSPSDKVSVNDYIRRDQELAQRDGWGDSVVWERFRGPRKSNSDFRSPKTSWISWGISSLAMLTLMAVGILGLLIAVKTRQNSAL